MYKLNYEARTKTDQRVYIPEEVANNQLYYDNNDKTFPIEYVDRPGMKARARLDGDAYGLRTSGTGDIIVRIV
jgi:hypothetical protein